MGLRQRQRRQDAHGIGTAFVLISQKASYDRVERRGPPSPFLSGPADIVAHPAAETVPASFRAETPPVATAAFALRVEKVEGITVDEPPSSSSSAPPRNGHRRVESARGADGCGGTAAAHTDHMADDVKVARRGNIYHHTGRR